MEEVRCPRCSSSGEIPAANGKGVTVCFVCGGRGYIDKQDYEWKSQWGAAEASTKSTAKTAVKASAKGEKPVKVKEARPKMAARKTAPKPVDTSGRTPLHLEASDGNIKQVRLLLEGGADPNARDVDGRAPIHWPALRGHVEIVQALIEHQADINARDNAGRTPLRMATIGNCTEIITILRDLGGEL